MQNCVHKYIKIQDACAALLINIIFCKIALQKIKKTVQTFITDISIKQTHFCSPTSIPLYNFTSE